MNLTNEQKDTLRDFMEDESLWRREYGDYVNYYGVYQNATYGVEKEELDEKLAPLIEVLKIKVPSMTMFCSFITNKKGIDGIRMLTEYGGTTHFVGVRYENIDYFLIDT